MAVRALRQKDSRGSMKPATKIAIRRITLRWLRKLVDLADDRLHTAEVTLREEISGRAGDMPGSTATARKRPIVTDETEQEKPAQGVESFLQWEARRSGVTVVSKKTARRQRRVTAAVFDLRQSSQWIKL